ncbi:hypothetical protein SKAU_G00342890 [Synaphobranchus kaupii]|uniref:RBR-type E3 ubiquitin transferase n=1 Tax=Synaphobranchus kaupii TaxID=118154 RepID=A0A9Q1EIW7_SYNKA|nr:hypothetical protein SKAU_G00342890 [Synaphobranchus kaupii]
MTPPPPKPVQSPGVTPSSPPPAAQTEEGCKLCGSSPSLSCPPCGSVFCETCDEIFHRHPERNNHAREKMQALKPDNCTICGYCALDLAYCPKCDQRSCLKCDDLYHSHPDRKDHQRIQTGLATPQNPIRRTLSSWECASCTTVNEVKEVLCTTCERPRLVSAAPTVPEESPQPVSIAEWQCQSCTAKNSGSSVLCSVCERHRLATHPPAEPKEPVPGLVPSPGKQWTCQHCTYVNSTPSTKCEMCELPRPGDGHSPAKPVPPSPVTGFVVGPVDLPRQDLDFTRQKAMKEDGLKLIQHIREGDKKGVSPEVVYAALSVSRESNVNPCDWLKSELPHLLDEICAVAASVQQDYKTGHSGPRGERLLNPVGQSGDGQPSRVEAKQAWVAAGGDTEKAVQLLLRNRRAKVRELCSLGFTDEAACEDALRQSGGEVQGALCLLQRPLLEDFRQRVWSELPLADLNPKHPDREWLCRRLLALYDLPSWGRCELVLSLLLEPGAKYSLEDVVQAAKDSQDREAIKRRLKKECLICMDEFPQTKMKSLTYCQCSVCVDCFQQHFTIAVKDKHIRDMVCPNCSEPDINDHERLGMYFTFLDIQLKDCLEENVYNLFVKKLTEHTLIRDPNFRWCTNCSYGFIYEGNELKVTCEQCRKSFCNKCKKPWEDQHAGLTCEEFQTWKRENDPEYQKQGLAGYLQDNGITCPYCKFQYALSKGGCMHFSCSQCTYQFCSGCNNPFHTTACSEECRFNGLHAHHPRDCLFYMRDWEPERLQALLQRKDVEFNIEPPHGAEAGQCGVIEVKEEGNQQIDSACGGQAQPGQAGLCLKHYREYLVSLINDHSIDPASLYDEHELIVACQRYRVDVAREEAEEDEPYRARLMEKLMNEVPLGEKVPRKK